MNNNIVPLKELALHHQKIADILNQQDLDAILLSSNVNQFYTTGFVFNGYVYIDKNKNCVIFAKRGFSHPHYQTISIYKEEQINEHLSQYSHLKKIGIETAVLSYQKAERLINSNSEYLFCDANSLMRECRKIKTSWEIDQIRASAKRHISTYRMIPHLYKHGMSDLDLQIEIEYVMRRNGSIGVFHAFGDLMEIHMGSLLAGKNADIVTPYDFALGGAGVSSIHPLGATGEKLQNRTSIMIDMSGNYGAYMTDITRVYFLGEIDSIAQKAHETSIQMHQYLINQCRSGDKCADIYTHCVEMAEKEGLSHFFMGHSLQSKFVGHGIGLEINELPIFTPRSKDTLEEGMVFAFEPKFVIPNYGAVGIENSYAVINEKIVNLTPMEEEMIALN